MLSAPQTVALVGDTSLLSMRDLAEATNRTFDGYFLPIHHDAFSYAAFCRMHDVDAARSVRLHTPDNRLIGTAMLAVRHDRGWCGGFGIVPEYRGQGLSHRLIAAFVARAREMSLRTLQLECLTRNVRAVKVYQQAGFTATRSVHLLRTRLTDLQTALHEANRTPLTVQSLDAGTALRLSLALAPPSETPLTWQREWGSLTALPGLRALAVHHDGETQAVLLYRINTQTGSLALDSLRYTAPRLARQLLQHAVANAPTPTKPSEEPPVLTVLNEPPDTPLYALLHELGLQTSEVQHEMHLALA